MYILKKLDTIGRIGRRCSMLLISLFLSGAAFGVTLPSGGSIEADLTLGNIDTYTFSANAGDEVSIQVADTGDGQNTDVAPNVILSNPDGSTRSSTWSHTVASLVDVNLSQTGTYTVQVSHRAGVANGVGPYIVHFAKAPGANEGGVLPNGGARNGALTLGDIDTYTFSANAGDEVSIQVADTGDGQNTDVAPNVILSNPDGSTRSSTWSHTVASLVDVSLSQTGTYTVQVSHRAGVANGIGPYILHFAKAPGANEGGALRNFATRSDGLTLGDIDTYTFSANTGDEVNIQVVDAGDGQNTNIAPHVILSNPDGSTRTSTWGQTVASLVDISLSQTGTYTIQVSHRAGQANGIGPYFLNYNCAGSCGAAPPTVPQMIAPKNQIQNSTPTYQWYAVSNATWYQLEVSLAGGLVHQQWYTSDDTGCSNGVGTCQITPAVSVSGSASWRIRGWNSYGNGNWSSFQAFTVTSSLPGKAVLISPSDTGPANPQYTWEAVSGATWYYLWVNDDTGTPIRQWYSSAQASCSSTCTVTGPVSVQGSVSWWIQTWNSSGTGPWSDGLNFTVSSGVVGTPTLLTPSGAGAGSAPVYSWSALSGATWYQLWVNDSTGNPIQKWYQVGSAGITCTSTTCSVQPTTTITGSATWWVRGWNSSGNGPWSSGVTFSP